ncbi:MAG: hypothetical protein ACE15E_04165 [Acidobacteriota bacterium]
MPPDTDIRQIGARVLSDLGMPGPFFAARPGPGRIVIGPANSWKRHRVTCLIQEKKVRFERLEPLRWYQVLTGFHLRSGYGHDDFLSDLWAVTLDLVCIGFLLWIVSGIYMWWRTRPTRFWGMTALVGGFFSFILLLLAL